MDLRFLGVVGFALYALGCLLSSWGSRMLEARDSASFRRARRTLVVSWALLAGGILLMVLGFFSTGS